MHLGNSGNDTPTGSESTAPEVEHPASSGAPNKRTPAQTLPTGLRFGKYQIVRLIAVGGMSEVYEAIHSGLDKRVALKVLRPDLAENTEARERFLSEGVNAARIRHTNVVDVTDVGMVDDLPYLVMTLLEGEDLGMLYSRQGRLPIADLIDLLLPVASAIAVGHAYGIVHRDLKPDNIFLHQEGCRLIPKVLDFGVSRAMHGRRITVNTSIFGTPQYMSPEQARGTTIDARTDQYALGVILYEGVTGHLPRDSANALELLHSIAFDSFHRPSQHVELPEELESVILRAMSQDPADRFASMRDLALALLPFASAAAREYWEAELRSIPDLDAAAHSMVPVGRRHTHPPQSPLLVLHGQRRPSVDELTFETPAEVAAPLSARVEVADSLQPQTALNSPRPRGRGRTLFWAGALAGMLLGVVGVLLGEQARSGPAAAPAPGAPEEFEVDVRVHPESAAVLLDGTYVGSGSFRARLPKDGAAHVLRVTADGFTTHSVQFRDEAPPRDIRLQPIEPIRTAVLEPEPGRVRAAPSGEQVAQARPRAAARKRSAEAKPARPAAGALTAADLFDTEVPRVRIVDEHEPRVRVID